MMQLEPVSLTNGGGGGGGGGMVMSAHVRDDDYRQRILKSE